MVGESGTSKTGLRYSYYKCITAKRKKTCNKKAIKKDYDAIIVNYSNADMVGHTGNYEATVKSLEVVDGCLLSAPSHLPT